MPQILVTSFCSPYPLNFVVLFFKIIPIEVYLYLECHSSKAPDSNFRNHSSCPDGGKSQTPCFFGVSPMFWWEGIWGSVFSALLFQILLRYFVIKSASDWDY